ncbi:hypothetical protein evm_003853 [Chilo suppressalis]|nr:hypothetical protein evm_003853 [Chilo suppressalis]
MADSVETPQSGGGEGQAPAISPPKPTEADKPVEAPTTQQIEASANQAQEVTKPVGEEIKQAVAPATQIEESKVSSIEESKELAKPATVEQNKEVVSSSSVEDTKKEEPIKPTVEETTKSPEVNPVVPAVDQNANSVDKNTTELKNVNWQERESELLKKIKELESVKSERGEEGLQLQLKVREEEIDLLKARVKNLETELQAALSKPGGKNHEMIEKIKQQHEELLSKAKGMIFDKTKMVKNQELQIEALTTQVQSLKDINLITKDLLEIRNSEVKAMEDRLQAMEARFKTEKERYGLVLQRAQTSSNINDDLKKEYETQLAIFKELREKYEQRVKALVAENEKLKESVKSGAAAPSAST